MEDIEKKDLILLFLGWLITQILNGLGWLSKMLWKQIRKKKKPKHKPKHCKSKG